MFELFGDFSNRSEDREDHGPIVHTRPLSDGGEPSHEMYWRDRVAMIGGRAYLRELYSEFEAAKEFRRKQIEARWPTATIKPLTDDPTQR